MKQPKIWFAVILLLGLSDCATPAPLYQPAVAEKPRGDEGYRADLSDCKFYEAQTRLGIATDFFGAGGLWGAQYAQSGSSDRNSDDVIDYCMRTRGYSVL